MKTLFAVSFFLASLMLRAQPLSQTLPADNYKSVLAGRVTDVRKVAVHDGRIITVDTVKTAFRAKNKLGVKIIYSGVLMVEENISGFYQPGTEVPVTWVSYGSLGKAGDVSEAMCSLYPPTIAAGDRMAFGLIALEAAGAHWTFVAAKTPIIAQKTRK